MTDLVTIRKYIAGLIRKERARRRKAETSVAELVTEIENWRSRADKTDAEIISLEERLEQLQDERRDQAKGHQSDAWCWTAERTKLEKERDEFAKDRQNWKTLANEKGAELNKATERVSQLEKTLLMIERDAAWRFREGEAGYQYAILARDARESRQASQPREWVLKLRESEQGHGYYERTFDGPSIGSQPITVIEKTTQDSYHGLKCSPPTYHVLGAASVCQCGDVTSNGEKV